MNQNNGDAGKRLSLILLMVLTLAAGLYRNGFPAIFPYMQEEFGLSRAVIGLYTSFLYLISAGLAVFAGWIADQMGSKKGLLLGMGSLALLILLHAVAPSFTVILVLAALCGVGFSIISPGASKAVSDLFSAAQRGTPMGLLFMGWSIGGVVGAAFLPLLAESFGWRLASVSMGVFMLGSLVLFQVFFHDSCGGEDPKHQSPALREGFSILMGNHYLLLLCGGALILGSLSGTIATHYTLFIHLDYGYSKAFAGLGFAFLHAGSILGRPAWGFITDRWLSGQDRLWFLLINLMNALAFLFLALVSRLLSVPPVWLILALTFLTGFSARGWPGILFAAVSRQASRQQAGMALGLALVFLRLGVTLAPPFFGYIADLTGTYELSWFLVALFSLLSGLAFFLLGNKVRRQPGSERE